MFEKNWFGEIKWNLGCENEELIRFGGIKRLHLQMSREIRFWNNICKN